MCFTLGENYLYRPQFNSLSAPQVKVRSRKDILRQQGSSTYVLFFPWLNIKGMLFLRAKTKHAGCEKHLLLVTTINAHKNKEKCNATELKLTSSDVGADSYLSAKTEQRR